MRLLIVLLGLVLMSACGPLDEASVARGQCEKFVTDRLQAPATAKFSPAADTRATKQPGGGWSVGGWVDSQNTFGALIRSNYNCVVSPDSSLAGLSITPR